jgi:hypothetical protein
MFDANLDFPFSKISLTNPTAMQGGGAYFAKLAIDGKPIRLQLPKTTTKAGIILTKRDCYTDLLYVRESESTLISWVDAIESRCKELLNEKKSLWFSNELSSADIDGMLIPLVRTYKGDSMLIMRIAIETSKRQGSTICQIYDDNENKIDDADFITTEHIIIPLIVVEGIKFTSKSIDVVVKMVQIMAFNPLANECMINYKKVETHHAGQKISAVVKNDSNNDNTTMVDCKDELTKIMLPPTDLVKEVSLGEISELPEIDNYSKLREIDVTIADSVPTITLKDPTELYREMYKVAKEKLRKLKDESFLAFLEAKQIKSKYNIDDLDEEEELSII